MKVNSTIATTSSRLNREIELLPEVEAQEQAITDKTTAYCNESLDHSRFFSLLKPEFLTSG
jgi:hypothetical protein